MKTRLFIHNLVGASEEGFGNRKADRFRGFDVDHQLKLGRLLNRQITRLLAFEDATGAKQPFAIAMKDGAPFGIAGIWENWKEPASGEWIRTFAIITTDANELVADIHDRMPVILAPNDYARWLSEKPDPRDLMRPFPAELMRMWPISTRVNKPENDDPSIVEPIQLSTDAA
jgi:putative SOS response-associated peptidase YedK